MPLSQRDGTWSVRPEVMRSEAAANSHPFCMGSGLAGFGWGWQGFGLIVQRRLPAGNFALSRTRT